MSAKFSPPPSCTGGYLERSSRWWAQEEIGRYMSTTARDIGGRNTNRDRLLKQMKDAQDGGTKKDADEALAEAKRWLRANDDRAGNNAIRSAQFQLHKAFPPAH